MLNRLIKDESGMALGLAVIMILLIGVMGAGLLTFVQSDLSTVVKVNQGQKALEIADAGAQAAKRQLLSDSTREHYDLRYQNDCVLGQRVGEDWSPTTTGYPNADCSGVPVSKTAGVARDFAGGRFTVTIQCMDQTGDPDDDGSGYVSNSDDPHDVCAPGDGAAGTGDNDDGDDGSDDGVDDDDAPEAISASSKTFFRIISTGCYPADCSGAKRKVEVIYNTNRINIPTAYYTPKDIEFNGNVNVSGVSFFAKGNIKGSTSGSVSINRSSAALYGDWNSTNFSPPSNHNTVSRVNGLGQPVTGVGLGAEGKVCADNGCTTSAADNVNDYDSTTAKKFCGKPAPLAAAAPCSSTATVNDPNPAGTISYPFDPNASINLELLKEEAQRQGRYFPTSTNIDNLQYNPATSSDRTVFFVDAGGSTIDYRVNSTPVARGTIVVNNGNLKISNSSNGFDGIIIVTGDGVTTGLYDSLGNATVKGFVIADGNMKIGGTVAPFALTGDFTNRPGFYSVNLWSWRELYQ